METSAIELIGMENYNKILTLYDDLISEENELTDEHSEILNTFIESKIQQEDYTHVKQSNIIHNLVS